MWAIMCSFMQFSFEDVVRISPVKVYIYLINLQLALIAATPRNSARF